MFFLLLIGMIGFVGIGNTVDLEQNSKSDIINVEQTITAIDAVFVNVINTKTIVVDVGKTKDLYIYSNVSSPFSYNTALKLIDKPPVNTKTYLYINKLERTNYRNARDSLSYIS